MAEKATENRNLKFSDRAAERNKAAENSKTTSGKTSENSPKRRQIKKYRYHDRSEQPSRHALECVFGETTNRIGFHSGENSPPIALPGDKKIAKQEKIYRPGSLTLFFGVMMPLLAVAVEANSHVMARHFFDPFPTPFHVLMFLLIPVSNFLTWLAVRKNITPMYSTMSLCSGMALGIAILYTFMLLPQTSLFFNLLGKGVGFLGLSPLFSIPFTLACGQTICKLADREKTFFDAHQLKHLGHLIVLVMVIMVELPSTMTRFYLSQADRASLRPTTESSNSAQAIKWLRQWGSPEVLLRACYERSGEATDILGSLAENIHPVPVEHARAIYYKVTGVAFNSVPIPPSFRGTIKNTGAVSDPTGLNEGADDEFDLDPDIAGELVSGVARGLSVSESRIDGTMNSATGVASIDWSFTFENVSAVPREARAKLLLPPNAVITKASINLDGVEKETVIQERGLARNTYLSTIYSQKKDPLLVSMTGQDSVLVQCYPVRKGSVTKIKLHIVSPLVVSGQNEESLSLPTFEERNFAITIPHQVKLSGDNKISMTGVSAAVKTEAEKQVLNAAVDNSLLARFSAIPKIAVGGEAESQELTVRPPESSAQARQLFYSQLPAQDFGASADKVPVVSASSKDKPLTILVDKSITMAPYMNEIVTALSSAPSNIPISLVEVKDGFEFYSKETHSGTADYSNAIRKFSQEKCEGGQSDASALDAIVRANAGQGAILWIHAAQPIADVPTPYLYDQLSTRQSTRLYDLQVASGPNVILNESYNFPALTRVVRSGSLEEDLKTFLSNYSKNEIRRCATTYGVRTGSASPEVQQVQAYKLALARYQAGDRFGAFGLAQRYHLVTPVSSAVVNMPVPEPTEEAKVAELRTKASIGAMAIPEGITLATPSRPQASMSAQKRIGSALSYSESGLSRSQSASSNPRSASTTLDSFQADEIQPASPILQGSTNGTIGAQSGVGFELVAPRENAADQGGAGGQSSNMAARSDVFQNLLGKSLSNLSQSSSAAAPYQGGLVAPPFHPSYGQSNEVGSFDPDSSVSSTMEPSLPWNGSYDSAPRPQYKLSHKFFDATTIATLLPFAFLALIVVFALIPKKNDKQFDDAQLGNPFKN